MNEIKADNRCFHLPVISSPARPSAPHRAPLLWLPFLPQISWVAHLFMFLETASSFLTPVRLS